MRVLQFLPQVANAGFYRKTVGIATVNANQKLSKHIHVEQYCANSSTSCVEENSLEGRRLHQSQLPVPYD